MTTRLYVAAYLAAIVAANLSVAHFGPRAAIYNAFLLIGLDLVTRDKIHDSWRGRRLGFRMGALIVTGSVLSYVLGEILLDFPGSGRIALASALAFCGAATVDALVYHALRNRTWYERANQSNIAGGFVDSVLFLPLAFGTWPIGIMFAQFCAKVAGGFLWSFVLSKRADGDSWMGRNREMYGS